MKRDTETGWLPADDVNRAKSIVTTVWLGLQHPDVCHGNDGDVSALTDTLYNAIEHLARAERNMGVHK